LLSWVCAFERVFGKSFLNESSIGIFFLSSPNKIPMQKFLLIMREDLKKIGRYTDEERFSNMPIMQKWIESIAESGNYIEGNPLDIEGRYVRKDEVLSDGPFIEAKEGVSGFDIIKAENLEQAVAFAQACPLVIQGLAAIEVRPMSELSE
jgi:hypothetical protein